MIIDQLIKSFVKSAKYAGFKANAKEIKLLTWSKGKDTHKITKLPVGFFAVYIFEHKKVILKVGKVCGGKNNDRYYQHHYIIKAANSTLARSLENDLDYSKLIADQKIRDWIIENTSRYNILVPIHYGRNFVNFAEAFFILVCNPKFEGKLIK